MAAKFLPGGRIPDGDVGARNLQIDDRLVLRLVPGVDQAQGGFPILGPQGFLLSGGRLHRLHDNKREVIVYDYVDGCVAVLSARYSKGVRGYEAVGYSIQDTE